MLERTKNCSRNSQIIEGLIPSQRIECLPAWNGPKFTSEEIDRFCANGTLPQTYRENKFFIARGREFAPIQPEAVFVRDFERNCYDKAFDRQSNPQQSAQLITAFVKKVTNLKETGGQGLPPNTKIYFIDTAKVEELGLLDPPASLDGSSLARNTPVQDLTAAGTSMLKEREEVIPSQFEGIASLLIVKFLEGKVYIDDYSADDTTKFLSKTFRDYRVDQDNNGFNLLLRTCGVDDIREEVARFVNYCYTILNAQEWKSCEERDKSQKIVSYIEQGNLNYQKLVEDILRNDTFLTTNPQLSSTLYEFYWAIWKEVQKPEQPSPQNQNRSTRSDHSVQSWQRPIDVPGQDSYEEQVNRLHELEPVGRIRKAAELTQQLSLLDGIVDTSNFAELKLTYRKVVRALHPDSFRGTDACPTDMAKRIVQAVTAAWADIKDEQN